MYVVLVDLTNNQQLYTQTYQGVFGGESFSPLLTVSPGIYQLTSISDGGTQGSNGESFSRFTTDLQIVPLPPALFTSAFAIAAIMLGRFVGGRKRGV